MDQPSSPALSLTYLLIVESLSPQLAGTPLPRTEVANIWERLSPKLSCAASEGLTTHITELLHYDYLALSIWNALRSESLEQEKRAAVRLKLPTLRSKLSGIRHPPKEDR